MPQIGRFDSFCQPINSYSSQRRLNSGNYFEGQKQKSSELSFAALWFVPSPRYFAKLAYWFNGLKVRMPASVLAQAPAGSTRTTASSSAQNARIPVWLTVIGVARIV